MQNYLDATENNSSNKENLSETDDSSFKNSSETEKYSTKLGG